MRKILNYLLQLLIIAICSFFIYERVIIGANYLKNEDNHASLHGDFNLNQTTQTQSQYVTKINYDKNLLTFFDNYSQNVRSTFTIKTSDSPTTHNEFSRMLQSLSAIAQNQNMTFDFVLIGACDGTADDIIEKYFANSHWRGVFVEPIPDNFNNMTALFKKKDKYQNRSYFINAAVSDSCSDNMITIYAPAVYENRPTPHHIKNQMASVRLDVTNRFVEAEKTPGMREWKVPCATPLKVIKDAQMYFDGLPVDKGSAKLHTRFQPMLIKIDTEGHDGVILKLFMSYIDTINMRYQEEGLKDCEFPPYLFLWEKDKLDAETNQNIDIDFKARGYALHGTFFKGPWHGRDMYSAMLPSSEQWKRLRIECLGALGVV